MKKPGSRKLGHLLMETVREFRSDNALKLSAALSYYAFFALPPLLIIIIALCGVFFGKEAVRGEIFGQINGVVGNATALQIQEALKNIKLSSRSTFATSAGVILLIMGASAMFAEIQDSLNLIWGLRTKPQRRLIKFLKNRLISFAMIGSAGVLVLAGLVVNSLMDVLPKGLASNFSKGTVQLFYALDLALVFAAITLLFTIIFKTLPNGQVALRDAALGASLTAVLFMIGKFAIGAYLGKSTIATAYGAAGSVIVILVWVYYSAIILYFGAEFTKVYANTRGRKIIPNEDSVNTKERKG